MLDAVQFENLGVPAAAILTEPFRATGLAMAALHGYADYPFATVPHPVTSLSKQGAAALADAVTPHVERLLLAGAETTAPAPASPHPLVTDQSSASARYTATVPAPASPHPLGLDEAVEALAVGLRSDGADLTAEVSGRRITLRLHIPDQACAECVMPAAMLAPLLQNRIDNLLGDGWAVELDDPRVTPASA